MDRKQRGFIIGFNLFTIFLWGWFLLSFLARGRYPVIGAFDDLYLITLTFYAGDKEIHRWRHQLRSIHRRGELFVVGWVATIVAMVCIEILGGAEHGYRVPPGMAGVVAGVVILFLITEYLKSEFRQRR